mgnify:CR=1 FL=1
MNDCVKWYPLKRVAWIRVVTLFAAAWLFAGCSTVERTNIPGINEKVTVVEVPFEGEVARVEVKLSGFLADEHAVQGLNAIETSSWATAERAFSLALQDQPNNWSYHFALAVVLEIRGDYERAAEEYRKADQLYGGDGYFDAKAGMARIEFRAEE